MIFNIDDLEIEKNVIIYKEKEYIINYPTPRFMGELFSKYQLAEKGETSEEAIFRFIINKLCPEIIPELVDMHPKEIEAVGNAINEILFKKKS